MKLPQEFIQQLQQDLPEYAAAILEGLLHKPCISVRQNVSKVSHDFDNAQKIPWHPNAYFLEKRPIFTLMPTFHAGAFYVQEASSMLIHAFIPSNAQSALDLCAAPGGKTTLLIDALPENSLVVANELISSRNNILCENVTKWGNPHVIITQNYVSDFQKIDFQFDVVLLDAPCSGEGMFRKDPNAIQEWSIDNVDACAKRQKDLITDAWKLVKPGGRLIYSTCTFNKKENEEVCQFFQATFSDFSSVKIEFSKEWKIVENQVGNSFIYRCLPGVFQGEGFSVCAFDKIGNPEEASYTLPLKKDKHNINNLPKNWIQNIENYSIKVENGEISIFSKKWFVEKEDIEIQLKIRKNGLSVGFQKGKDFVPSHDLALSNVLSKDIPFVELDEKQALTYLKKEIPNIEQDFPDGWILAKNQGLSLGWLKKIGKQWKNYLPKEYRIRMEIN